MKKFLFLCLAVCMLVTTAAPIVSASAPPYAQIVNDNTALVYFGASNAFTLTGAGGDNFIGVRLIKADGSLLCFWTCDFRSDANLFGWLDTAHTIAVMHLWPGYNEIVENKTALTTTWANWSDCAPNSNITDIMAAYPGSRLVVSYGNDTAGWTHIDLAQGRREFSVSSVKQISNYELQVQFNHKVTTLSAANGNQLYSCIRLVDANGWVAGSVPVHSFDGEFVSGVGSDTLIWRIKGDASITDLLAGAPDGWRDYLNANAGSSVQLVLFEDSSQNFNLSNTGNLYTNCLLLNIKDENGQPLAANKPGDGKSDESRYGITPLSVGGSFALNSATAVSDYKLSLSFSSAPLISGSPFMAIRYLDANGNLAYDNTTPLQFYGTYEPAAVENELIWRSSGPSIQDIIGFSGKCAAYADKGYTVKFCIEECDGNSLSVQRANGVIDNLSDADGNILRATNTGIKSGNAISYDSCYVPIAESYAIPEFCVRSALWKNNQVTIEFSEPAQLDGTPFIGIRYVDENNDLIYDGATPIQFYGSYEFTDDTHTKLIWRLSEGQGTLEHIMKQSADLEKYAGSNIRLCIEEIPADTVTGDTEDETIHNIVNAQGTRLYANKTAPGTGWDGNYTEIGNDLSPDPMPDLYVKRVIAGKGNSLVVEFNVPVTFDGEPFMALRFVDDNNELQFKGETPLQFYGSWRYYDDAHDKIVWSLNAGQGTVQHILERTEDLSEYNSCKVMFCIEEIPADKTVGDTEDGTVHNLTDGAGHRLYANKVRPGSGWDGLYTEITVDYDYAIPDTSDNICLAAAGLGCIIALPLVFFLTAKKRKNNG